MAKSFYRMIFLLLTSYLTVSGEDAKTRGTSPKAVTAQPTDVFCFKDLLHLKVIFANTVFGFVLVSKL